MTWAGGYVSSICRWGDKWESNPPCSRNLDKEQKKLFPQISSRTRKKGMEDMAGFLRYIDSGLRILSLWTWAYSLDKSSHWNCKSVLSMRGIVSSQGWGTAWSAHSGSCVRGKNRIRIQLWYDDIVNGDQKQFSSRSQFLGLALASFQVWVYWSRDSFQGTSQFPMHISAASTHKSEVWTRETEKQNLTKRTSWPHRTAACFQSHIKSTADVHTGINMFSSFNTNWS